MQSNPIKEPYTYGNGYIALPLDGAIFASWPDSVTIDGRMIRKKSSFHVSLVCVKEIAPLIAQAMGIEDVQAESALLQAFDGYVKDWPVTFDKLESTCRRAKDDEDETIVAECRVSNLSEFFERIRAAFSVDVNEQPTHVTIYTLRPDKGIGITSREQMHGYPVIELRALA